MEVDDVGLWWGLFGDGVIDLCLVGGGVGGVGGVGGGGGGGGGLGGGGGGL